VERPNALTSRRGSITAGAVLAVALLTSGFLAKRSAESIDTEPPPAEALVGLVRPTEVDTVAAPAALTIAEVLVAVGDELAENQCIARRDITEDGRQAAALAIAVEAARQDVAFRAQTLSTLEHSLNALVMQTAELSGQLAVAELQVQQVPLRQAKDSPDRARAAYEQAQVRARRAEGLSQAGLLAQQEVEDARLGVRLAADDLANARQAADAAARLHDLEVARGRARSALAIIEQRQKIAEQRSALGQARLQLKGSEMRYADAQAALADPFIHAPRGGAVIELPVSMGEHVAAGALIARVGRLDQMAVYVDVAPNVVNALHVDGKARIEVTAAGLKAPARIRSIAPLPNDAGKYPVQLVFQNPSRARLAGQAAQTWLDLASRGPRP
jgi:multidrug efflux pump subunit AcrA (membrane-fusion protein)